MLEKILEFIISAGDYGKANQVNVNFADSKMKSASSYDVVTETDLEISRRFRQFVEAEFSDIDYVIVDEETVADLGAAPMQEIKRHEYAFIIDPIDGTLTYSEGLPFYGVSIGVFHNQQPVASAVYLPSLGLLIYCDEESAFVEESGVKRPIGKLLETAALYANHSFFEEDADQFEKMNIRRLNLYSSACNGFYTAAGKLRGWTAKSFIWDIAGIYGVFAHTGVKIFDTATNQPINLFDEKLFDNGLRLKSDNIICLPKYYQDFKKLYKV
jgi:myo-inositol-1(or 4)-monophosphatase